MIDFARSLKRASSPDEMTQVELVNLIQHGGTDDWRWLYGKIRQSSEWRARVRRALRQVDPVFVGSRRLWETLLEEYNDQDGCDLRVSKWWLEDEPSGI
ncbi:hypothetical protein [Pyrinomonas methylaliphatogenes]|jgi:uncharacterized protein YdiU (UPF0061 family)|uniref:Uncharacterized protein n=1 Tax=Pyrinomonas methylaliphatogenes TaxID=454194 RepID=A0A0B6X181_9BACT|nr:hypothetical protein [Pyrinomonas methylaliphatogenes]CDM66752.1 hypothetical protein PYK22_02786 [Pyrinomonas methylaliphatogenes]